MRVDQLCGTLGPDDTHEDHENPLPRVALTQRAGKSVEMVVQSGEDHWQSRGETRLQTLEATIAFLEKNNPPN